MVFSSLQFIFGFLPAVLCLYFAALHLFKNHKNKILFLNSVLLISSLYFYIQGEKKFVWVMLLTGTMDYFFALLLQREQRKNSETDFRQKALLVASIIANMGLLFYFKYINFAVDIFFDAARSLGLASHGSRIFFEITLPIGISFYTFESMSYIIDVYRRETTATRKLVDYWTFITFFPHLIAGPIIRYVDLRRQLENRQHSWENFLTGFRRFVVGLSKKVIIANPMGYYADYLFALDPSRLDTVAAWLAALAYTLQIYFDFSGYSDMAIGLARIFGIQLPQNFNYPYVARNIQDFWRRWHMTLSSWFRDYLYIPLGGNRAGSRIEFRNLFVVFVLCGLWHGASLNFLFWGVFHGTFLVIERIAKNQLNWQVPRFAQHVYAVVVIMFAWVIFRAETMSQAIGVWGAMLGFSPQLISVDTLELLKTPHFSLYAVLGIFLSIPLSRWWGEKTTDHIMTLPRWRYDVTFAGLFLTSVVFLCGQEYNPFIYFRF